MKPQRIANKAASAFVTHRQPFRGSNLYGECCPDARVGQPDYIVYSYGPHWPLYIHIDGRWFANGDRYSVTTSKHASQAHPAVPHTSVVTLTADQMRDLVDHGVAGLINPVHAA